MARDTTLAVLFPGQGSQTQDMRARVEHDRPDLIPLAREEVGDDPFDRADEGTRWTQPAIFCASLAGWKRLEDEAKPALMGGHSMGEISALVAAGALGERDGLRVVAARGRLMEEAGDAAGDGGMLAVLGDGREAAVEAAAGLGLTVANDNGPGQVVLSGEADGLEAAAAELKKVGLRSRRLSVQGAFHSPAMEPIVPAFRELLAEIEVRDPEVPVLSCVTAEPFDDVRERLAQSITNPVRWLDVMRYLHGRGVRRFVEVGPGKVLAGLVRRALEGVETETLAAREPAHA
jgi:[acyl-carrier-protein] S-malonyltransferase